MPRVKTEQLVALILYRSNGSRQGGIVDILIREMKERLLLEFGRSVTTAHIRRLIRKHEHKGVIERELTYLHTGRYGDHAQASRYLLKDILSVFDLFLSDKDLETMTKAKKKKRAIKAGMPLTCFRRGYLPSLAYIENYSPYYKASTQADLGPKYPRGDPRNMDRQKRVNTIMIRLKRERQQAEKDALAQS